MRFRIGTETFEAGRGDAVLASKGVPHTYGNAQPGQPARYLVVMTPRIRSLIEALHSRGADDVAAIFAAHDSELLTRRASAIAGLPVLRASGTALRTGQSGSLDKKAR